jgi:hypothetical protein
VVLKSWDFDKDGRWSPVWYTASSGRETWESGEDTFAREDGISLAGGIVVSKSRLQCTAFSSVFLPVLFLVLTGVAALAVSVVSSGRLCGGML